MLPSPALSSRSRRAPSARDADQAIPRGFAVTSMRSPGARDSAQPSERPCPGQPRRPSRPRRPHEFQGSSEAPRLSAGTRRACPLTSPAGSARASFRAPPRRLHATTVRRHDRQTHQAHSRVARPDTPCRESRSTPSARDTATLRGDCGIGNAPTLSPRWTRVGSRDCRSETALTMALSVGSLAWSRLLPAHPHRQCPRKDAASRPGRERGP